MYNLIHPNNIKTGSTSIVILLIGQHFIYFFLKCTVSFHELKPLKEQPRIPIASSS